MKIDLSKINLNLLVALDALMKEKHVTNAGKRLHITQSAMSNTLKQLREVFKDPLFIRGQASRLIPTAYALKLEPCITETLEKISCIFQAPEKFNPKEAKNTFTIGLSDYSEFVLLPTLVQKITQQAPGIQIIVKHLNYLKNNYLFEYNEIDLAIGIYKKVPDTLIAQTLFTDRGVCVGDKKNPLLKKSVSGKDFANAKQLVILYSETRDELLSEQYIKQSGFERKAVVTMPHTLTALYSLVNTELVAMILERVAKSFIKNLPLTYQPFILATPTVTSVTSMVWHPKDKNNAAHRWLRETVIDITRNL